MGQTMGGAVVREQCMRARAWAFNHFRRVLVLAGALAAVGTVALPILAQSPIQSPGQPAGQPAGQSPAQAPQRDTVPAQPKTVPKQGQGTTTRKAQDQAVKSEPRKAAPSDAEKPAAGPLPAELPANKTAPALDTPEARYMAALDTALAPLS